MAASLSTDQSKYRTSAGYKRHQLNCWPHLVETHLRLFIRIIYIQTLKPWAIMTPMSKTRSLDSRPQKTIQMRYMATFKWHTFSETKQLLKKTIKWDPWTLWKGNPPILANKVTCWGSRPRPQRQDPPPSAAAPPPTPPACNGCDDRRQTTVTEDWVTCKLILNYLSWNVKL